MKSPANQNILRYNSAMKTLHDILNRPDKPPNTSLTVAMEQDNLLGIAISQFGGLPLLTAEEELVLGRYIQAGLQAQTRLETLAQDDPCRPELEQQIEEGHAARDAMFHSNLRLVVSLARQHQTFGLEFLDLIQEGCIGLLTAIDKFDPRREVKFSVVGQSWIQQSMIRAIANQSRTIRVPVHTHDRILRLNRVTRELEQSLNRQPTLEEIAAASEEFTPEQIEFLRQVSDHPASLDIPARNGSGDHDIWELIEDAAPSPEDIVAEAHLAELVQQVLAQLSEREQYILRGRLGMDGEPVILEDLRPKLGITRERVRQIEKQAMIKLRLLIEDLGLQELGDEL